ncbi:replication protein A 70 kDa DNA-binding subunit B [Tanacetum coccineum]
MVVNSGDDSNKKITPISEVDPILDNIAIQGRCISIWHSHRLNAAHDPYSLDLVLQDAQNNRIQVYIKKEFMFRFEPLFEEGQCYIVSNFGIAENGGRLPLLPHSHKTVYVIGSVVGIGDIIPMMSAVGKKVHRTVVIEDAEGNRLDFTFWDNWATIWDEYAMNREAMGHVVFILQLCKVKYWDGTPVIHNALFGSKIFINRDLPEIAAFRTRVQDREGYDANQLMIQHVAPEVKVVTMAEFFHCAVKKMVGGIREYSHCIVYATIHRIHKEHGWAYTACKSCNKRVGIITHANPKPTFVCDDHGNTEAAPRFKVIVRLIDESGSVSVVFFNTNFMKLSKHTAWELMEKYGMDTDDYFPDDLDDIHFKKGFLPDEDDNERADEAPDEEPNDDFTTPSTLVRKVNMRDSSVSRVLDMKTPSKEASGSGESSGTKQRRVFIDLDELDTESEDDEGNFNAEDFVNVKLEPEE